MDMSLHSSHVGVLCRIHQPRARLGHGINQVACISLISFTCLIHPLLRQIAYLYFIFGIIDWDNSCVIYWQVDLLVLLIVKMVSESEAVLRSSFHSGWIFRIISVQSVFRNVQPPREFRPKIQTCLAVLVWSLRFRQNRCEYALFSHCLEKITANPKSL